MSEQLLKEILSAVKKVDELLSTVETEVAMKTDGSSMKSEESALKAE